MTTIVNPAALPDVAKENQPEGFPPIDWVGMSGIELPLLLKQTGGQFQVPARAEAKVSLDKSPSRGIHMSRLYLSVQEHLSKNELSLELLGKATEEFLHTHAELSSHAKVVVNFESPLMRKALKTDNQAWRSYPVLLSCVNSEGLKKYFVEVLITYSSTCPASAALSRQLIQRAFEQKFSNSAAGKALDYEAVHGWLGTTQGVLATPHAQRSFARVKVEVAADFDYVSLIDQVEESLQTAVQAAVKREDEQEFALRNGQNLMFCEDAARRVKASLDQSKFIFDYIAEFNHVESLHPHSAVSLISKGRLLRSFN